MATTKYGSYFSTSGYSNFLRPYITYSVSSTATTTTITVKAGINVKSGTYTDAKLTRTLKLTGMTSVSESVSKHFDDGSHQLYSKSQSYTRTTSAQSKTLSFKLASSIDSSTVSVSLTVPALNKYTLSYNTGGGSTVASQSLYYNTAGKVTTTIPTKTNYIFKGWSNSSGGSVNYTSGASITITAAKTLYAVWQLDYIAPTVRNARAYRVASDALGRNPEVDPSGTRAYIEFETDAGKNISNYFASSSASVDGTQTSYYSPIQHVVESDKHIYYGYIAMTSGGSVLSTDTRYAVALTIGINDASSGVHYITATTYLSPEEYVMDIANDGMRVAFGKKASHNSTSTKREHFAVEVEGAVLESCDGVISGISPSSFKTPTTGTITSVTMYRHNHIIYMSLGFNNTTSRGSGYAVLDTYLDYKNQTALRTLKPVVSSYGIGYFGSAPLTAFFGSSDGHFVIRNTSPSAVTVWNSTTQSGATVTISWVAPLADFSS